KRLRRLGHGARSDSPGRLTNRQVVADANRASLETRNPTLRALTTFVGWNGVLLSCRVRGYGGPRAVAPGRPLRRPVCSGARGLCRCTERGRRSEILRSVWLEHRTCHPKPDRV